MIRANTPDTGSYPRFLKDLQSALDALSARRPADEVAAMADDLAKVLWKGVESSRRSVARRAWRKEEREQAWDLTQPDPRCWICGYQFQPGARQQYLRETVTDPVTMPAFVDAYAPRGLRSQDLRIELDHVVALAGGGKYEDNLRLACGWCNRYKSSKQVLYDAIMELKEVVLADGQIRAVPPQFWVVRLLALRGRCESPAGCTATTRNAQLTVAPIVRTGAPTPTNLWVTCKGHDPLRDNRLVESVVLDRLKASGGSPTEVTQPGG